MLCSNDFELEAILFPRGHLAMSGDLFDGHAKVGKVGISLVSIGQRPEMVLNNLQCAGQPLQKKLSSPICWYC